jgi:surfactin synthase thioesterase subunit
VILTTISVFGFPFGGGDGHSYRRLREHLPRSVAFQTLELPGRGRRGGEPLLTEMGAITDEAMRWIGPSAPGPFFFFGHSMGALIAYEVTRRLFQENRAKAARLIVSGRAAPQLPFRKRRWDMPRAQFIEALRERGGLSDEALSSPELMDYVLPILRADVQAVDQYEATPGLPLDLDITVLIGDSDDVSPEEAQAWQAQTTRPIKVITYSGSHFFLFDHAARVAQLITAAG